MDREIFFWVVALVMVFTALALIAAAFVCPKVFLSSKDDATETNRELLNQELDTLEADRRAGLITEAVYQESVEDVRRRALEELQPQARTVRSFRHLTGPFAMALCCLVVALAAFSLYAKLGSPSLINFADAVKEHGIMNADGTLANKDEQYDVETLKAYVDKNPKDERAMTLYARLLVKNKDWKNASEAYARAVNLNGKVAKDDTVLLEYAASLMSMQTDETYRQGYEVVRKALTINENNLNAHELAAIASLELSMWSQARLHLEILLQRTAFDSPTYRNIAQTAAYAAAREREEAEAKAKAKKP